MKYRSTPYLRFKKFKEKWQLKVLGNLGSVAMNKRIFKEETSEVGEIPFYKIGTFGREPDSFITREKFEEYKSKYPYPEIGDILISASGSIGRTVEYLGEEAYFQDSNIVWLKHDERLDNSFLKQFYSIVKWQGIEGTTIKRLYNKNILETPIALPSVSEQSAIGSLFRTLDDLLTSYKDNLANYQSLKATMLSKMFPKAGQTVPEIRLDGFERKWEKKKLIDIVSPVSRKVKKPSDPYYRLSIRSHAKGTFKQFVDDPKKIAMDNLFEVKENDLVVNITFAWEHAIAVASKEDDGLLVSHRFPTYVIDKSDKNFINIYIKREEFRQKMDLLSPGGAGRNRVLNVKDFINIQMVVPELKEQQAIGAYFSNLDNLITAHQEKIFQFETLKKKLLQDMFI